MSGCSSIVIIGVGNAMRHDDGLGVEAVARLGRSLGSGQGVGTELLTTSGEPTRLIEAWTGRRLAVVIDAIRTGTPSGSIHRLVVGTDPLPHWASADSSHSAGLAEAVTLARALDRLPDELIIYGVEAANLSLGEGLSAPVEAALPALVRRVLAEVVPTRQPPVA